MNWGKINRNADKNVMLEVAVHLSVWSIYSGYYIAYNTQIQASAQMLPVRVPDTGHR